MAYHNMSNTQRNAQGQSAPAGFHYMPDGTLMANNDMNGYGEKVIKNFAINTKDVHSDGETRSFTINGDQGAIFSFEVYDDATTRNYYHFDTKLFSSSKPNLCLEELSGPYSFSVKFPAATALHTYTIEITAHSVDNIKTVHTKANEVRFADDTINHNASTGSNSNILKKILYQDLVKNLYLSCVAPSKYTVSSDIIDGDTIASPSNRIIIDSLVTDRKIVEVGDKVTVTTDISSTVHALVTAIDPDGDNTNELEIGFADGVTDREVITFTPAFNGMTPHYTDATTGRAALTAASGGNLTTSFTITCTALAGRTFSILRAPTINDLCAIIPISFAVASSSYSSISDEDTSGSTFYRWQIANIANLSLGMSLDPARTGTGLNTTTPATISNYRTTKIIKSITKRKYCTDINDITVDDVFVDGIHPNGNLITTMDRTGRVTAQAGNIIFSTQQAAALDNETGVRIFAYGDQIRSATGMGITLSNVEVKLTQISTTASESITSASGLTLASVSNISTASTIRGVGINPSLANPRVTLKTADTGSGDITLGASNTIVSGQTYYFDGASNIATITGTITVSNMAIGDTTLYFDVERFLHAV